MDTSNQLTMAKLYQKDNSRDMYPKPALSLKKFYALSVGEKVVTRYMGPGIVVYPPIRYELVKGVVKVYRDRARIKLSRKCWEHWDETEFPFYELTTNSYGYGD
jgi:hypothetical protein